MDYKFTVILAKADWCHFCKEFEPIFEYSIKKYKDNDDLKNYTIKFEKFNMADSDIEKKFIANHDIAYEKIQGYPTVFLNITNSEKKINNYCIIPHTSKDKKIISDDQQIDEASKRFLENIVNLLKTLNSDSSVLFVKIDNDNDNGNLNTNLKSDKKIMYKKKYLKYKSKYTKLKNDNF